MDCEVAGDETSLSFLRQTKALSIDHLRLSIDHLRLLHLRGVVLQALSAMKSKRVTNRRERRKSETLLRHGLIREPHKGVGHHIVSSAREGLRPDPSPAPPTRTVVRRAHRPSAPGAPPLKVPLRLYFKDKDR